jgi:hypothetical protein
LRRFDGGEPSRELLHLVDEQLGIERLLDEVVGARGEPFLAVVGLLLRGEHEHRHRGALALDLGAKAVATGALQGDVTENDGRTVSAEPGKRGVRRVGGDDAKVFAGKSHFQHFAHRDAVVDGEQGRGHVVLLRRVNRRWDSRPSDSRGLAWPLERETTTTRIIEPRCPSCQLTCPKTSARAAIASLLPHLPTCRAAPCCPILAEQARPKRPGNRLGLTGRDGTSKIGHP